MAYVYNAKTQTLSSTANPVASTVNIGSTVELIVLGIHTDNATGRTGGTPTQAGTNYTSIGEVTTKGGLCSTEMWYIINTDITTGVGTNLYSVPNSGTNEITVDSVRFTINTAGKQAVFVDGTNANGNSASPSVTTTGLSSGQPKVSVSCMTTEYHKTGPTFTSSDTITYGPDNFDVNTKVTASQYDIGADFSTTNTMTHTINAADVWHMIAGTFEEEDVPGIVAVNTVTNANITAINGITNANITAINTVTF